MNRILNEHVIDFRKETFVSQTNGFDPVTFPHSPMSSYETGVVVHSALNFAEKCNFA